MARTEANLFSSGHLEAEVAGWPTSLVSGSRFRSGPASIVFQLLNCESDDLEEIGHMQVWISRRGVPVRCSLRRGIAMTYGNFEGGALPNWMAGQHVRKETGRAGTPV